MKTCDCPHWQQYHRDVSIHTWGEFMPFAFCPWCGRQLVLTDQTPQRSTHFVGPEYVAPTTEDDDDFPF